MMKKTRRMTNRIISLLLAFVMACTMTDMTVFAQTADTPAPQAQGAEFSTGDTVFFGNYPQTEVTGTALTNAIVNASYDSNGDATAGGERYRRVEDIGYVTKAEFNAYCEDNYLECVGSEEISYTVEEIEKLKREQATTYRYFKWEPVKWRVLKNETETGTLFVMADTALDAVDYSGREYEDGLEESQLLWKDSAMRKWLNTDSAGFYHMAFSDAEREAVKANAGNPEGDFVYLLSDEEAKNADYGFENTGAPSDSRLMKASAYAAARGASVPSGTDYCNWYLRTPGDPTYVKNVVHIGQIYSGFLKYKSMYNLSSITNSYKRLFGGCVPVMHIDASSVAQGSDPTPDPTPSPDPDPNRSLDPVHHCSANGDEDTTDWSYIYFGSCPQTEVTDEDLIEQLKEIPVTWDDESMCDVTLNGKKYRSLYSTDKWYKWEPIKWRVLKTEADALFVAADAPVSAQRYNNKGSYYHAEEWEEAYVQTYLNGRFLDKAFSEREKEAIVPTQIDGKEYSVSLLSYEEATKEEYGFCGDGTKASASRQMNANDYIASWHAHILWLYHHVNPSLYGGVEWNGWWLRDTVPNDNESKRGIVGARFIPNYTNPWGGDVDNGSIEAQDISYEFRAGDTCCSIAYVVPALRVSKSSDCWSFDPEGVGVDPEVTQAVEDAISELESSYSQENYSDDNWTKVQAVINTAKEALESAGSLEDVASVLAQAKADIAKIPTKEEENPNPGPNPDDPDPDPEPEPDLDSLLPEAIRKKLLNRKYDTIDGGKQAMYSADHELTIEVFTSTTCSYSGAALNYLQEMNLPKDKVDIFSVEVYTPKAETIRSWAETYELDTQKITFCYSTMAELISENPLKVQPYAQYDLKQYSLYYLDGKTDEGVALSTPTYVFRDKDGKILKVTHRWQNTEELAEILESIGYGHLLTEDKKPDDENPGDTAIEAKFSVTYNQTEARQMLSRINEFRTGDGAWEWDSADAEKIYHTDLGALTYDYELEKAAMQRAADLVAAYSHTRPDGTSCFTAYSSAFDDMGKGENIAIGTGSFSEEKAFTAWKEENEPYNGQGHRRNMLNKGFQTVGIAHVIYKGCHYWVQEFGGGAVDGEEVPATDGEKAVTVKIAKDNISEQKLKSGADEIQMKSGQSQELPQVNMEIRTKLTWKSGPSLEIPVEAEWSVSSGQDAVSVSGGELSALKEGDARLTASYSGMTTEVWVTVSKKCLTEEDFQEKLSEYEGKLADYGETEKAELETLLETIKGKVEAALAEEDLEAAEVALTEMETALKEKAAGKKEEAKQELEGLKNSITADEELDDSIRAEIEAALREAETAVEHAKDATAVKEELAKVKEKIEQIKAKGTELKNARGQALSELAALEAKLGDYRAAEQEKIKTAIAEAKAKIEAAENGDAVKEALEAAKRVFNEQRTNAQLTEEESKKTAGAEPQELKKGASAVKGNLKFVVLDPVKKTASVCGAAKAKGKKFAVTIPATVEINGSKCKVTEVKKKGFAKFAKITKVTLGKNITKVGKNAFDGCKAIKSLTVSGDVKTFDSKCFNGCKKLNAVTFKGKKVPAFKSKAFKGTASKVKVKFAKMSKGNKTKTKKLLKQAGMKKIS